jgi:hypothetical protein
MTNSGGRPRRWDLTLLARARALREGPDPQSWPDVAERLGIPKTASGALRRAVERVGAAKRVERGGRASPGPQSRPVGLPPPVATDEAPVSSLLEGDAPSSRASEPAPVDHATAFWRAVEEEVRRRTKRSPEVAR